MPFSVDRNLVRAYVRRLGSELAQVAFHLIKVLFLFSLGSALSEIVNEKRTRLLFRLIREENLGVMDVLELLDPICGGKSEW